jgi:hypothetical protein
MAAYINSWYRATKAPQNHRQTSKNFLSTTDDSEIQWDSVLDQTSIDANLLRFNRRAVSASPCGHGVIHDKLTFNSLSKEASDLLSGSIPAEWHGDNGLLREFLTSFAIPDRIKNIAPIKTTFTPQD